MIYKIRVILNIKEDVIRDFAIQKTDTLENFHNLITDAFGFTGNEMASFYRSDEEWIQGDEFPLFDMSEGSNGVTPMCDITIDQVLKSKKDKLIYVYDFFNMWSFYVDVIDIDFNQKGLETPSLLFSLGSAPNEAPEIKFESQDLSKNDFDDDEDEDEFDEFDFDNFEELI